MNRQQGQALPLGISLILFTVLIGLILFNTGQLTSEKTKLANAADSAVYSGLIWQSRALNFQSYTNRAMVANQVTMAQAVSLRSWTLYGVIATENVNAILGSIPFVGSITTAMEQIMTVTEQLLSPITDGLISFVDAINGILTQAQSAMYATTFVATPSIVQEVVRKNSTRFNSDSAFSIVHSGKNASAWYGFTEKYEDDHLLGMNTKADVVNRSRDSFTSDRDWDFFDNWLYIAPMVKLNIQKRGETRLISTQIQESGLGNNESGQQSDQSLKWEWKGKDTLSLNTRIRTWRGTRKIEVPIGWGQAYANNARGENSIEPSCNQATAFGGSSSGCENWFGANQSAESLSDENTPSIQGNDSREKMSGSYSGLRAYRDLSNLGSQEKDPRLELRVEVESPLAEIMTSSKHGIGGVFNAPDSGAGSAGSEESLASLSSGEVYFKKPLSAAQNGHIEYANGYNPFWDVRLTHTPDSTRVYALLMRDVPLASGSVPAAGDALEQYLETLQSDLDILNAELEALELSESSDENHLDDNSGPTQSDLATEISSLENNIESIGAISSDLVGDYIGLSELNVQQGESLFSSLDPSAAESELEGYVQSEFDQLLFDPVDLVENQIQEELENALANILAGAVEGAVNSAVGANVTGMVGDSESLVDQLSTSVNETVGAYDGVAEDMYSTVQDGQEFNAEIENEFNRIQQTVSELYEAERLRIEAERNQAIAQVNEQIDNLQQQIDSAETDEETALLNSELADLQDQLVAIPSESYAEQAESLVQIVNQNTDLYEMDLATAMIVVQMEGDVGSNLVGLVQENCSDAEVIQSNGCEQ